MKKTVKTPRPLNGIVRAMTGMSATTGKPLGGIAHLRQSVRDILTTPLGTRVMRRNYGSRLFDLVDAPLNDQTVIEIYAATAEALVKWEPRILVQRVQAQSLGAGSVQIDVSGIYVPTGEPVFLDGISIK